jgi:glutaredoxin
MTKEFFKTNNVAYTEKDVSNDEVALQEMVNKSGQLGVPVIDVNGTIVVGFDKKRLAELLKIPLS